MVICSIPNLEQGCEEPVVIVSGRSLMPYCHFELPDSDYIRSGRHNLDLSGPIRTSVFDSNTRVIEFMSTGVGVHCSVKFNVVNPTSQDYSFCWRCEDDVDVEQLPAPFVCRTNSGVIRGGKKTQVTLMLLNSMNESYEVHSLTIHVKKIFFDHPCLNASKYTNAEAHLRTDSKRMTS